MGRRKRPLLLLLLLRTSSDDESSSSSCSSSSAALPRVGLSLVAVLMLALWWMCVCVVWCEHK